MISEQILIFYIKLTRDNIGDTFNSHTSHVSVNVSCCSTNGQLHNLGLLTKLSKIHLSGLRVSEWTFSRAKKSLTKET